MTLKVESIFLKTLCVLFIIVCVLFAAIPFLMIIFTSFKSLPEINDVANRSLFRRIFPDSLAHVTNYINVLTGKSTDLGGLSFMLFIGNSMIVTSVASVFCIILTVLGSYGLAKYRFPFRNVIFYMLLLPLMVPPETIGIPFYLICSKLKLINTYIGVVLPLMLSPVGILLIKESIELIPQDYFDAARVDGARELWALSSVILPMIRTSIITVFIIKFLGTWNTYLWPLLAITKMKLFTVPLGLGKFINWEFIEYHELSAAVCISLIPTMLIYLLLRRYIVEGVIASGIKM